MMDKFLAFIAALPDSRIENVYMVRQIVNKDFFTTFVLLDFASGIDKEHRNEAHTQVRRFFEEPNGWLFIIDTMGGQPLPVIKKIRRVPGSHVYHRDFPTIP